MPRSAACAAISTCGNTTSAGGASFLYSSVRATAAVPGESEILACLGGAVDLTGGLIVAHAIDLVVGEPQRLVFGVEVHAHRITDAIGIDLAVFAVAIHADD